MDLGSSPEADVTEIDPIEGQQPDASTTAASSPAADDKGEKSLLDSVQEALGSKAEPPAAEQDSKTSPSQTEATAEAPKPAADSLPDEVPEDEMKRYGPKTQARIRQLLEGRHAAREEANTLKPKAAEFDKFDSFVRENNLSPEDVASTFNIAALIRNKPEAAWEKITPIVRHLAEILGHVLPSDLQERVRLGYITEEDARTLATTRSKNTLLEKRSTESEERQKQEAERNRLATHATTCRDTANTWEDQKKSTDPDWNLKRDRITEKLKLKLHENGGFPESKQKVVDWLDDIHKQVTAEIKGLIPQPKPVTPSTGNASSRANAEPQTALEAAELALARR